MLLFHTASFGFIMHALFVVQILGSVWEMTEFFFSMLEQFVTPWLNFQKMTPLGRMELMVLYYLTAHDMVTVSALLIAKAAYTQLLSGLVLSSA